MTRIESRQVLSSISPKKIARGKSFAPSYFRVVFVVIPDLSGIGPDRNRTFAIVPIIPGRNAFRRSGRGDSLLPSQASIYHDSIKYRHTYGERPALGTRISGVTSFSRSCGHCSIVIIRILASSARSAVTHCAGNVSRGESTRTFRSIPGDADVNRKVTPFRQLRAGCVIDSPFPTISELRDRPR